MSGNNGSTGPNPYGPKWNETHYVTAYELARQGHSDKAIAKALGVSAIGFMRWKLEHPALVDALTRGRTITKPGTQGGTFKEYVFNRLPPHLQQLWVEVMQCAEDPNGTVRLEALFDKFGHGSKRARQHLFIYALTSTNFNMSLALYRLGISRTTLEAWCKEPHFAELLDEIHWHKKNFFEEALVSRVAAGSDACTIFANKTMNRDRYPEKVAVEVTGQINHTMHVVPVDALDAIPLEQRLMMLAALRERLANPQQQRLPAPVVLDAEPTDDNA